MDKIIEGNNIDKTIPSPRDIDIIAFLENRDIEISVKRVMARIIAVMQENNKWSSFDINNNCEHLYSYDDAFEEDMMKKLVSMDLLSRETIVNKKIHTVTNNFINSLPILKRNALPEIEKITTVINPDDLVENTILPSDFALYRLLYDFTSNCYERCLATLLVAESQKYDIWKGIPLDNSLVSSDMDRLNYSIKKNTFVIKNSMVFKGENLVREMAEGIKNREKRVAVVLRGDNFLKDTVEGIKDGDKRVAVKNDWTVGNYKNIIDYLENLPQAIMNIVREREKNGQKDSSYSFKTKIKDGKIYYIITFFRNMHFYSVSQEKGKEAIFSVEDAYDVMNNKTVSFLPIDILTNVVDRDKYISWIREFTKEIGDDVNKIQCQKILVPKELCK